MTWSEAASVACRATESWLRAHIGELDGFPAPDRLLDVFSAQAVRAWVTRRFGVTADDMRPEDAEAILLQRAHAQGPAPAPRNRGASAQYSRGPDERA